MATNYMSADETPAVLDLLAAHVPLSLLIDLTTPVDSRDVYDHEPETADWLPARTA
jgi:hypothetical protein